MSIVIYAIAFNNI